ncbi:F-box protein At4g09920-like [Quercus lobata]|uniref:F-box protein At4g09920-like n=1 Tax=Quercus lobata TaxID=97700 RepID=UPI001246FC14|nr:F-box protein At4g09920-like [Quercus lobata]
MIDRFSDLSNSLLCHILSFLTTKEAVATSILSRRWKTLWTRVPKLDLDTDDMHLSLDKIGECNEPINISYTDVLSRVLALHIAPFIRSFRLRCNSDCAPFHFDTWTRTAIARNVEELKLLIFYSYGIHMGLPCSIFYCQTLVALELSGGIDLDPPSSFQLPNLKILRLLEIYYCKDSSCFSWLLSGCPVLEDLSFERDGYDCLYHFQISVPTLKCLHIAFRPYRLDLNDYTIEIKAPALEYFKFEGDLGHIVLLEKLDNLFEADVYICSFDESDSLEESQKRCYGDRVFKLLRALTTAKFLLLFPGVTECYYKSKDKLCWMEPPDDPGYLSSNLTSFNFRGFKGLKLEVEFVKYILKEARILKTMTINVSSGELKESVVEKLSKVPRLSRTCLVTVE